MCAGWLHRSTVLAGQSSTAGAPGNAVKEYGHRSPQLPIRSVRRGSLRHCVFGIGVGLAHVAGAAAQSTPTEPSAAAERYPEVIVTGSRLPETAGASSAPVIVLAREDIERGGADSIADALQALPMNTGVAVNTNVDVGGLGAARMNLRGLGPERTLVLLNGRRLPNGGVGSDTSVDLNMLPVALVDRVEVLTSGASAVYGADAVGGVVNVITRPAGTASSVAVSSRITGHGDGQVVRGVAALGFDLAGGAWSLGVDYVSQRGVKVDQRAYSAQPLRIIDGNGTLGYAGQSGIPDGEFVVPPGNLLGLSAGRYMRIPGASGQTAADYRPFTRADSYDVSPFNYSQTPNERGALWLLGSQPLTGSARLFIEGLYHRRESSQGAAPEQFLTLTDPTPTLADGSAGIPASNYYNPFGVDLPFAARRFVEGPVRVTREDIQMWRLVVGAGGGSPEGHWELAAGIAQGRSTTRSQGLFALSRYVDALGPSGPDASGQLVCGAPDPLTGRVPVVNIIPGCVPLDIFDGAGSITRSQLDYLSPRTIVDSGTNEQRFAQAVFGGRVRGGVSWAAGAEYRREAGNLAGDPLRALQYLTLVDAALSGGSFDSRELFAELNVPLLAGHGAAPPLSVSLGARWSQFSSFGTDTSWDAGLHWQLTSTTTVRATYATVFRAPDLQELYAPRSLEADYAFDPCGNQPNPTQRRHCAADGVPGGAYVQGDAEFAVLSGGNPALQAETGETYALGVVYEPAWLRGFSASADLFDIELSGVVAAQDVDDLLYNCATYGTGASCAAIHREPDGHPLVVAAVNRNFGHRSVRGVDFALDGQRPMAIGNLAVGLRATYLERYDEQPFTGGQTLHQAGATDEGPLPRWRATAHLDWRRRSWYASYALEYIGSMTERVEDYPPLGIFFATYARQVSSALYHEIEAHYSWPHGIVLELAITNLTDKAPPFLNTGLPENTDPGTYPLLGRTFFAGLSGTF